MHQHHARVMYLGYICILLGIALTSCSTQSVDEIKALHRDRARELVEKQQFREALIEFQNVVKLDPRDDEAQFELAFCT